MNANITHDEQRRDAGLKAGIRRRFVQVFVTCAIQAVILFIAAGQLNWLWAWLYVGIYLVGVAINAAFMLRYSPETIAERAETRGAKEWDRVVAGLGALMYFVLLLLVAGLDARFGWTGQVALTLHMAGAVAFVLGGALFSWAMISNAYFSGVVRIQVERGHAVCTTGPYRFVRHPGYVGMIIQSLALPLMLGSLWALIPAGLTTCIIILRTALEDKTLHEELTGYAEYAQQTRYRLLPGVW